ncbi:hypothetical protein [Halovenus salina]|uniref:Uncharacterized protein n=1 Tax=Halovenus salina TaxID=1510225 RepID=A0ABD5VZ43_9EURY|nr:hypothetical protein [Halovenus salina]
MLQNDRRVAVGCWVLAGLPIVATFVQALLALVGIEAVSIPVIGELKQTLDTVEVFDAAGVVFRDNDVAVFGLFILVALSWLAVAVGMFVLEDRQFSYAAAGLVTVFLALFSLVYSPLLWEGVPALQLVGFVTIPVVAVGSIWVSVTAYEWTVTVESEVRELLTEAREQAEQARLEFEDTVRAAADAKTLDQLSEGAPRAVSAFDETTESFETTCLEIQDEADRLLAGGQPGSRNQLQEATQLRDEADALAPRDQAQSALDQFRADLAQELRTEYGTLSVRSEYGQQYAVRNMGGYNELSVPDLQGPPVQIGGSAHELGERLGEAVDSGTPLPDIALAVEQARTHIESMREEVERHESQFAGSVEAVETALSDTESALSRVEETVADRLGEMLFESRFGDEEPPFPTEVAIRERLDEAKADLHNCRFERAHRSAEECASDAAQIKQIGVFFANSVAPTIEHGSGSIPIPTDVGADVIGKMGTEIRQAYDVQYTIEGDTLSIDTADEQTTVTAETTETTTQSRSGGPPPEDVLYLLRELDRAANEGEPSETVTIQLGEYPEKFAAGEVTDAVESFCARQTKIAEVEAPDAEPGYIKLVVDDNESPSRVLSELCDRYREQFG